ncbi:unnamed protein product [Moneuplotes crassus]|uniref:Trichohyalin-plectin-homology domain-containing protein n=1 Tax=Euplotes crassus TaxID=5936 RepID=A0AAD1U4U3_EUPCR|nr:unnamed protein product [Moneuplotes crassus]
MANPNGSKRIHIPTTVHPNEIFARNNSVTKVSGGSSRMSRLSVAASRDSRGNLNETGRQLNQTVDFRNSRLKSNRADRSSTRYRNKPQDLNHYQPTATQNYRDLSHRSERKSRRSQISATLSRPRASRRNATILSASVDGFRQNSNEKLVPNSKRHLPINVRNGVFDEWAAIVKHQDEIDREIKRLQDQKKRERQLKYRKDLDQQNSEFQSRKKGALNEEQRRLEEIVNLNIQRQKEKDEKEEKLKKEKLETLKNDTLTSIQEQKELKRYEEQMKKYQTELLKKKAYDEDRIFSKNKKFARVSKIEQESQYRKFLSQQVAEKQKIFQQNVKKDAEFGLLERRKLEKEDQNRRDFFNNIKEIQLKKEKAQNLAEFISQDPVSLKMKRDEDTYIRNIEIENEKALKRENGERNKRKLENLRNTQILNSQIKEKEAQRRALQQEAARIAESMAQEAKNQAEYQKKLEEQAKMMKYKCFKDLKEQVRENNEKKAFSQLMTDHEKKVNSEDMNAFQNYDNRTLYALVPGYDSYNKQEDYIDKSMKLENLEQVRIGKKSGSNFNPHRSQELKKRSGNPPVSVQPLSNIEILNNKDEDGSVRRIDVKKFVPKVVKKMSYAESKKYRANTLNNSYGGLEVK